MTTILTPASFSRNNGHPVSDALHKSNRLPVCLRTGGGERSETAVSVPASCSLCLSVFLQPRLISAFQLFSFFFNSAAALSSSYGVLGKLYICALLSKICLNSVCYLCAGFETQMCVLLLIWSCSAFPEKAQRKLLT